MTNFPDEHLTTNPTYRMPQLTGLSSAKAAAALAAHGFRVFPCHAAGDKAKRPKVKWTIESTNDPAAVSGWWSASQIAAIGLPMGRVQFEGAPVKPLVVDIDNKAGVDGSASLAELETELGTLPPTYKVATPSGGEHRYFTVPRDSVIGNSAGKLAPGIDVRCDGGYVIAPASVLSGRGTYVVTADVPIAPLPERWLARLQEKEGPRRSPSGAAAYVTRDFLADAVNDNEALSGTRYGRSALEAELQELRSAAPGTRNDSLNKSAFGLGQLIVAGHLVREEVEKGLFDACIDNGHIGDGEDIVRGTIESGINAGIANPRAEVPFAHLNPLTEDKLALEFAARHSNCFRFNHSRGKWLVWDGSCWHLDDTGQCLNACRAMVRPHAENKGNRHFGKVATAKAILSGAAADKRLATIHSDWDQDDWALGVPGGLVDLKTGNLLPPDPARLLSQHTIVAPAPSEHPATCG